MIKIQDHLDRDDAENYLDTLAEELWVELNPKIANGSRYKATSLVEKCKKYSLEAKTADYRIEYADNNAAIAARHKSFFDFINANNSLELKKLIISRPNQFNVLRANILKFVSVNDLFTGTPGNYSQTAFGKLLSEKIFDYTKFRGSEFCKELFVKLGFTSTTCPYCNDNKVVITRLKSNSTPETKRKAYLDLDHFYAKSQNPFFAVSFFNLIPTCHDCNSIDKRDKLFTIETHIHPYHEAFDSFYKFRVSLKALLGDAVDEIVIEKSSLKPLDITLDDLNLADRYNTNILQAEKLVKYFADYKHYIGTPDEGVFIDAIFELNGGIPKDKKNILKSIKGKMSRDILTQVDVNNVLGIS